MAPKRKPVKRKRGRSTRKPSAAPPSKRAARSTSSTDNDFPVKAIQKILEQHFPRGTVDPNAAAFLSTVLQYVTAEIIEGGVSRARMQTGVSAGSGGVPHKVKVDDVGKALGNDPELKKLLDKVRGASQKRK